MTILKYLCEINDIIGCIDENRSTTPLDEPLRVAHGTVLTFPNRRASATVNATTINLQAIHDANELLLKDLELDQTTVEVSTTT